MSFLKTVLVVALVLSLANVCIAEKAPQKIVDLANSELAAMGNVHLSDVEFDDSVQAYMVQVSVLVRDGATPDPPAAAAACRGRRACASASVRTGRIPSPSAW